MPSWKIHIKIGDEISKHIKVNRKYFLLGNLLPDQDKYNIPHLKTDIDRKITHFITKKENQAGINLPDYNKMYKKYKNKMDNPILLGYLVHLMTDFYWNNYVYKNYFFKGENKYIGVKLLDNTIMKCDFKTANAIKQHDFMIFSNSFSIKKRNYRFFLNNRYFKEMDELKISKIDIYSVINYFKKTHDKLKNNEKYLLLTEKELVILLDKTVNFVLEYLRGKEVI